MTLFIDADHLIYSGCAACECDIRWDEWICTLHLEIADVKQFITDHVDRWRELTGDDDVVMCFSSYPTFRHVLEPSYKANRIGKRKPLGLRDLMSWARGQYRSMERAGLEADDVMGLNATAGNIIVSIDKDMRTVPCRLLVRDELLVVTPQEADRTWMEQALTGDTSDGYAGVPKVGPKTAQKLLEGCSTLPEMWDAVVKAYRKAGMSYGDALRMARLARILRPGDLDDDGQPRLWEPDTDPRFRPRGNDQTDPGGQGVQGAPAPDSSVEQPAEGTYF